jgi:hypothetical protein
MSVVAPPPILPSGDQDDVEALIREARARQRRRRLTALALTALVAGAVLAAYAVLAAEPPGTRERRGLPNGVTAAPRCTAGQLRLDQPRGDGAGTGHVMESVSFTNTSSQSCTLRGWPVFDVVLQGGHLVRAWVGHIRNATSSHALPVRAVLLGPGGAASFHAYEDDGTGLEERCGLGLPSARVLAIPPGSSTPARGAVAVPYCHNPRRLLAWLSPVVAGSFDSYLFR